MLRYEGGRLTKSLVEVANPLLMPPKKWKRGEDFSDFEKTLDELVNRYSKVLEREDLNDFHLSTIAYMTIKVAERSQITDRLILQHSAFLKEVLRRLRLSELNDFRLGGTMWAVGRIGTQFNTLDIEDGRTGADFVKEAVDLCLKRMPNLEPSEIVDVITALANLQCEETETLVPVLASVCRSKQRLFKPTELCRVAWALGELGVSNGSSIMQRLAVAIRQRLETTSPWEVSHFIWACGRLKIRIASSTMSDFMTKIEANVRTLKPKNVTRVLWALTQIPYRPRFEFLDMLEVFFATQSSYFLPSELTICLHALAVFGYAPKMLLDVFKATILDNEAKFNTNELCDIVWSLSILDALDLAFLQIATRNVEKVLEAESNGSTPLESINDEDMKRLYHCKLHLEILEKQNTQNLFSKELEERCSEAWNVFQKPLSTSPVVTHVLHNFEYMGYTIESPYFEMRTGFCLNCVQNTEGQSVVIEIVTETQCFVNEKHRLQGSMEWRHKIIKECGWSLMILYEDVWMSMEFQDQANYLAENVLPLLS